MTRCTRTWVVAVALGAFVAAASGVVGGVTEDGVAAVLEKAHALRDLAIDARQYDHAEYAAREIARIDPDDGGNVVLLAEILARVGKDADAGAVLADHEKRFGRDPRALCLRAFLAGRARDAEARRRLLDGAARSVLARRGESLALVAYLRRLGLDAEAEHVLRAVLAPGVAADADVGADEIDRARRLLATLLREKGDLPGAIAAARAVPANAEAGAVAAPETDDGFVRTLRIEAHLAAGRAEEALDLAHPLIEDRLGSLDPPDDIDPRIEALLITGLEKAGRGDDADRVLRRAQALLARAADEGPFDARGHNDLALLYVRAGKSLEEAARLADLALRLAPYDPEILDTMAEIEHRRGRRDAAVALARRALAAFLGEPRYYARRLALFEDGT